MNSLRTWTDALNRRTGCRVPRYARFTPACLETLLRHTGCRTEAELDDWFDMDRHLPVQPEPPPDYEPPDYSVYYRDRELPPGTEINDMGVAMQPAGFYHFWGYIHPLINATSTADIEAYPLPDLSTWQCDHLAQAVAEHHARGFFVSGSIGHTYETAWQIRGYEEFLTDLMLNPEMAELLLDRITDNNCITARETARAGADFLFFGDDVANQRDLMFPPELWRRVFKPRLARAIAAGRREAPDIPVWYHSDGNITAIVPDLTEIGVTILNPVQPECLDPLAIHARYGKHLALDGTIGTQQLMPFGTTQDVRATVKRMIRHCGEQGGLILSPTHVLEPDVPAANVIAFFDACAEYGNG